MVFGYHSFCTVWGGLWLLLQTFSVFLVCTLSITRTISLLSPLRVIKKKVVVATISIYEVFLLTRMILPLLFKYEYFFYTTQDVYCWSTSVIPWFAHTIETVNTLTHTNSTETHTNTHKC